MLSGSNDQTARKKSRSFGPSAVDYQKPKRSCLGGQSVVGCNIRLESKALPSVRTQGLVGLAVTRGH
jgi:hypothetical protein